MPYAEKNNGLFISTHVLHAEDDSKNRENSLSSLT